MLTFQLEPWKVFWSEAQLLWKEHYEEIGAQDAPMDVEFTFYEHLEWLGQLQVTTARKDGKLIGYVVMLVRKHPHYALLAGFEDAYFLTKEERRGRTGVKLIQAAVLFAQGRGVKKVFFHSKTSKDLAGLYKFLGFVHSDELWTKVL